jgi:hypothetical protein
MLTRRNALLVPALAAVSACQRPTLYTCMTGPADAAWVSAYADDRWYGQLLGPVPLAHVVVQINAGARESVWEIACPQTGSESVRRVQYGILPPNFTQIVVPRALSEDESYVLTVTSRDYNEGVMTFAISNGRVVREYA